MFQQSVKRSMSLGPRPTYLIGYIHNGVIDSVKIKGLSIGTGSRGSTDLELITKQVANHLDLDDSLKILSITHLGEQ